jgi:hypothetical protein
MVSQFLPHFSRPVEERKVHRRSKKRKRAQEKNQNVTEDGFM